MQDVGILSPFYKSKNENFRWNNKNPPLIIRNWLTTCSWGGVPSPQIDESRPRVRCTKVEVDDAQHKAPAPPANFLPAFQSEDGLIGSNFNEQKINLFIYGASSTSTCIVHPQTESQGVGDLEEQVLCDSMTKRSMSTVAWVWGWIQASVSSLLTPILPHTPSAGVSICKHSAHAQLTLRIRALSPRLGSIFPSIPPLFPNSAYYHYTLIYCIPYKCKLLILVKICLIVISNSTVCLLYIFSFYNNSISIA